MRGGSPRLEPGDRRLSRAAHFGELGLGEPQLSSAIRDLLGDLAEEPAVLRACGVAQALDRPVRCVSSLGLAQLAIALVLCITRAIKVKRPARAPGGPSSLTCTTKTRTLFAPVR